jgi:pimeloyl-ACP methyl ester carboxylesterase
LLPLIILPGLDGTGRLHTAFHAALAGDIDSKSLAYPKDVPMGYEALVDFVIPQLPREGGYVLLAESFSGPLVIKIASLAPPGLAGLIFCATFAKNPSPWLKLLKPLARRVSIKSIPRWVRAPLMWGRVSPKAAPAQVDRAVAGVADEVLQHRLVSVLEADESQRLRTLKLPVLILEAQRDLLLPRRAARLLAQSLPQAKHTMIDGPHLLLQSRPEECAAAVKEFMRGL